MKVCAVIPAHNEAERIGDVIKEVEKFVDRVVVVDDGSEDTTGEVAEETGADVLKHEKNRGYLEALKTGFHEVNEDIVITVDADGEMDPNYIPRLLEPIEEGETSLVLGKRRKVPRISERFLSSLAGLKVEVSDTGTGFRALRTELAKKLDLKGVCPCGTFVLEARKIGADIQEVPVRTRNVEKPKGIAWKHFFQFWYILKYILLS